MSVTTTAVWEVRPATGSDNNGGMFKPGASGTDYSQQTSPQFALSGIASAGAGNTILYASAAATMVGNGLNVVSGTNFNTGIYEITSVSVGVSITVSTNVSGASICTGVGAAGVMNIGGALATVSKAITAGSTNNQIYLKGTYTVTTVTNIASLNSNITNNDNGNPLTINGYSTARDDGTRATWTTATNSMNILDISSCNHLLIKNINFTNTAGTKGSGATGGAIAPVTANANEIFIALCSFNAFNIAVYADYNTVFSIKNLQMDQVEISGCVSHGAALAAVATSSGCFFHGNGGDGYHIETQTLSDAWNYHHAFLHCVFYSNTANGLTNKSNQLTGSATGGAVMITAQNCAFVSNTGDGVNSPANHSTPMAFWNCIFYGNGGYGVNAPNVNYAIPRCNAYGSNTTAARNNYAAGVGDVALSANPFTNAGAGDFSLNNTAGGGAACRAAGFPGVTSAIGTGYIDIGPLQHQDSGGGSSGYLIQLNDILNLTDSDQLILNLFMSFSDSFSFTDSTSVGFISQSQSASDSLSLSDSMAILIFIGFGPVDTISLSDSMLLNLGLQFNETLNLSDTLQLIVPKTINLFGDFLVLSDRAPNLALTMALGLSDSLSLTDSFAATTGNDFVDSLSLSDAVVVQVNANVTVSLSDSLSLSDNVSTLLPEPLNNYLRRYLNDVIR